jgi:hypothetical protein
METDTLVKSEPHTDTPMPDLVDDPGVNTNHDSTVMILTKEGNSVEKLHSNNSANNYRWTLTAKEVAMCGSLANMMTEYIGADKRDGPIEFHIDSKYPGKTVDHLITYCKHYAGKEIPMSIDKLKPGVDVRCEWDKQFVATMSRGDIVLLVNLANNFHNVAILDLMMATLVDMLKSLTPEEIFRDFAIPDGEDGEIYLPFINTSSPAEFSLDDPTGVKTVA